MAVLRATGHAKGTATAYIWLAPIPPWNGQSFRFGHAVAKAEARVKTGKRYHLGQADCCGRGIARATAAQGSGTWTLTEAIEATARAVGAAAVTGPYSRGNLVGRASASASSRVVLYGEPCTTRAVSLAVGIAIVNEHAEIKATATAYGEFRIIAQADVTGNAYAPIPQAAVVWSGAGDANAEAAAYANQWEAVAAIAAKATTKALGFTYYPTGALKLKGVGFIMQNLLPQYMQDGESVKKLLEAMGGELERAVYLRDGRPPLPPGLDGLLQQFLIDQATWGVDIWESMAGIPVQTGVTDYVARRGAVLAQLGARKKESEFYFKQRLEDFTGGNVIITLKDPAEEPYTIDIESNVMLAEPAPATPMLAEEHILSGTLSGTYTYRCTFLFVTGETDAGNSESNSLTVTNKRILVKDVPVSPTGALARKIYRKDSLGGTWRLVKILDNNNVTSFTDNMPNATAASQPQLSVYNTAITVMGKKFLTLVAKTKPAHLHAYVRSDRFRASINKTGDPV